jgi:hypothetical protein
MPFSGGRSVRAPASNATMIVTACVLSIAIRCSGRPLSRTALVIVAM